MNRPRDITGRVRLSPYKRTIRRIRLRFHVFIFVRDIADEFQRPFGITEAGIDEDERLAYPENLQRLMAHSGRYIGVERIVDFPPFPVEEEFNIGIELDKILGAEEKYPLVTVGMDMGSHTDFVFRFVDVSESEHQLGTGNVPFAHRGNHRHGDTLMYRFPGFEFNQVRFVSQVSHSYFFRHAGYLLFVPFVNVFIIILFAGRFKGNMNNRQNRPGQNGIIGVVTIREGTRVKEIVLASASPRRKALLGQIGLIFTVDTNTEEDNGLPETEPHRLARAISLRKAESAAYRYPDAVIIAADTFGVIDGRIIGKPHSEAEARQMLASLSGRPHTVITGFTVLDSLTKKTVSRSVETTVFMKSLTREEIDAYVATGEPLDKAGAYAIQGMGAMFVERIDGDYYNVMGLPLCSLTEMLKEFGITALQ